jgi:hypothetical protein
MIEPLLEGVTLEEDEAARDAFFAALTSAPCETGE